MSSVSPKNTGAISADDSRCRRHQYFHLSPDVWRTARRIPALVGSFRLVISPALLDELDEKLRIKFEIAPEDADLIRARLEEASLVVEPALTLTIIKMTLMKDRGAVAGHLSKERGIVDVSPHFLPALP